MSLDGPRNLIKNFLQFWLIRFWHGINQHRAAGVFGLSFLFSISLFGQSFELQKFEESQHIAGYFQIIEDQDCELDVAKVSEPFAITNWEPVDARVPDLQFTTSCYWLHCNVTNRSETEQLMIKLARPLTNIVELHVRNSRSGITTSEYGGDEVTFCSRDLGYRHFAYPIELKKDEAYDIYVRVGSDGEIITLPIQLWKRDAFLAYVNNDNLRLGIFYGFLIFVILLFGFFGFILKQRIYSYFVGYVFMLFFMQLSIDGLAFQYLWPGLPWLANHAIVIFSSSAMIGLLAYAKQYLNIDKEHTTFHLIYSVSFGLLFLGLILSFTWGSLYAITFPLLNASAVLLPVLFISGSIIKYKSKGHIDVLFLLAFVTILLSAMLFVLANVGIIQSDFLVDNAIKIGSMIEITFLSVAMVNRYRKLQITALAAQKESIEALEEVNAYKQKQNQVLEQKVEERTRDLNHANLSLQQTNEEIIDSITYAKRLQEALMPDHQTLATQLRDYFMLFKPKDIVSGDFYWSIQSGDRIFFAAVDCTGHGVPGAMVSMVGYNGLNKCVKELDLDDPGIILEALSLIVEQAFSSGHNKIADGMDISIGVLDFENNKLEFAGAKNPLYLVRNGEVHVTKGDRRPIGYSEEKTPFTTHSFDLIEGDCIYLFSDGYPDQFGGPRGKKFGYRRFRELLMEISSFKMSEQQAKLEYELKSWQQDQAQVDDITVIGVKI